MNTNFLVRYALMWAANSVLFYLASWLYPSDFVLGTINISMVMAAVFSGFLLTLFGHLAKRILKKVGLHSDGRYKMFVTYWLGNSIAIWLIARMAPFSGLGISAYYWAFGLGFVATLVQWLVRQLFKAMNLL